MTVIASIVLTVVILLLLRVSLTFYFHVWSRQIFKKNHVKIFSETGLYHFNGNRRFRDPLTGEIIEPEDTVVINGDEGQPFLYNSWQFIKSDKNLLSQSAQLSPENYLRRSRFGVLPSTIKHIENINSALLGALLASTAIILAFLLNPIIGIPSSYQNVWIFSFPLFIALLSLTFHLTKVAQVSIKLLPTALFIILYCWFTTLPYFEDYTVFLFAGMQCALMVSVFYWIGKNLSFGSIIAISLVIPVAFSSMHSIRLYGFIVYGAYLISILARTFDTLYLMEKEQISFDGTFWPISPPAKAFGIHGSNGLSFLNAHKGKYNTTHTDAIVLGKQQFPLGITEDRHCKISFEGDTYYIEPEEGHVYVNGEEIRMGRKMLNKGDIIDLVGSQYTVTLGTEKPANYELNIDDHLEIVPALFILKKSEEQKNIVIDESTILGKKRKGRIRVSRR